MQKRERKPKKREARARVNMRLPLELTEWLKRYADKRNSTFTQVVVDELTKLQSRERYDF